MATQILCLKKRGRDDSADSDRDSAEVKRLRDDLLGFLDDSEPADESTQDLDSFMKSFQAEITPCPAKVIDLTSDSGESQPDLGYLFEASDDDLGIPPSDGISDVVESVRAESDSSRIGGFWGIEEEQGLGFGSYGGFGAGEEFPNGDEFVGFDGLFGYSDVYFDSSDYSDLSWRSETMPTL